MSNRKKKIISKKSNWILSWKREMKMFWFRLCQTSSGSIHFWCNFCAKVKLPLTKGIFYACLLNLWWRSMCMWKAEGMQLEAWVSNNSTNSILGDSPPPPKSQLFKTKSLLLIDELTLYHIEKLFCCKGLIFKIWPTLLTHLLESRNCNKRVVRIWDN